MSTRFESVRQIADAVMFEGYVLYPYRASSAKNRFRFPFGALAPRAWSEATGTERWWLEAQCLIAPRTGARLHLRARFLHAARRRDQNQTWDEGQVREIDLQSPLATPLVGRSILFSLDGAAGSVREQRAIRGAITLEAELCDTAQPLIRLRLRIANLTPWSDLDASRDAILPSCLLATHLLAIVTDGSFVSITDPPAWAQAAAGACKPTGLYTVLAGSPGTRDAVLAAPIILYDHPAIAPESPGDFFDATEIDELLSLRTLTLTDDEKREARATDSRAAAIVDRVEAMPPAMWERLHGAIRELDDVSALPTAPYSPGTRVRLLSSPRKTDAQDVLYEGCTALVEELFEDVDGRTYLGVTVDGDPGRDLRRMRRQYLHYLPDEVEIIENADVPRPAQQRVLIAGIGNIFFRDDGFGVEVAARLATDTLPHGAVVRDFGVRGLHLAFELCEPLDLVILVDTASRGGKPGTIYVIEPELDGHQSARPDAHGMDIPSVLATAKALGATLPRIVVVGCEPADIDEGMGLSPAAKGAIPTAIDTIFELANQTSRAPAVGALTEEKSS